MLAQIRAASSPMFSFRHQIRIFIRYFFFPVYILLYLLRNALALGQSVYADPMA